MAEDVPPAKRRREESIAAATTNAESLFLNQVSAEFQVLNYFKACTKWFWYLHVNNLQMVFAEPQLNQEASPIEQMVIM